MSEKKRQAIEFSVSSKGVGASESCFYQVFLEAQEETGSSPLIRGGFLRNYSSVHFYSLVDPKLMTVDKVEQISATQMVVTFSYDNLYINKVELQRD